MTTTRALLMSGLVAALGGGCLLGDVEGIPCAADGDCPTTYFCDLPHSECAAEADGRGIPVLEIPKVRDPAGDQVFVPKVPLVGPSHLGLIVKNTGEGPAEGIGLSFATLACVHFAVDEATMPAAVAPGATTEIGLDVTPGDQCGGVKIVDWFLTFSGRSARGTFDLDITDR